MGLFAPGMWDLAPCPGIKPFLPTLEGGLSTTWPPGQSLNWKQLLKGPNRRPIWEDVRTCWGFLGGGSGKEPTSQWRRHKTVSFPGMEIPGRGHRNPLQYSCLENPMDRGAWRVTVHRAAKSQTRLKRLSLQAHGTCWLSWNWQAELRGSSLLQTLASHVAATWSFPICRFHLRAWLLSKSPSQWWVCRGDFCSAGVMSVYPPCLHSHGSLVCGLKVKSQPRMVARCGGSGSHLPAAFLFLPVCLLISWSAPCCVSQIIQQVLEIYFNSWLQDSMLNFC